MDIFSETQGLYEENLGSALLRYLIVNSQPTRERFLSLLSNHSPVGPFESISHFACHTEYPTQHTSLGSGRLDLLVQLDDVVIGIENKFFSKFGEGQPEKYLEEIERVALALTSINRKSVRAAMFVLCPGARKQESEARLRIGNMKSKVGVVTWEEVIRLLKGDGYRTDSNADTIRSHFLLYLERKFSFVHDFDRKYRHLRNGFPDYGSPLQRELVSKLWSYFPQPGARLSNGRTWQGYYFYGDKENEHMGWYGFVPKIEFTEDASDGAELIVASTFRAQLSKAFVPVTLKNENFIGRPGKTHAWIVQFQRDWNDGEKWRQELEPFWSVVASDPEVDE